MTGVCLPFPQYSELKLFIQSELICHFLLTQICVLFFFISKMDLKIQICLFLIIVGTVAVFGRRVLVRPSDEPQQLYDNLGELLLGALFSVKIILIVSIIDFAT